MSAAGRHTSRTLIAESSIRYARSTSRVHLKMQLDRYFHLFELVLF